MVWDEFRPCVDLVDKGKGQPLGDLYKTNHPVNYQI